MSPKLKFWQPPWCPPPTRLPPGAPLGAAGSSGTGLVGTGTPNTPGLGGARAGRGGLRGPPQPLARGAGQARALQGHHGSSPLAKTPKNTPSGRAALAQIAPWWHLGTGLGGVGGAPSPLHLALLTGHPAGGLSPRMGAGASHGCSPWVLPTPNPAAPRGGHRNPPPPTGTREPPPQGHRSSQLPGFEFPLGQAINSPRDAVHGRHAVLGAGQPLPTRVGAAGAHGPPPSAPAASTRHPPAGTHPAVPPAVPCSW